MAEEILNNELSDQSEELVTNPTDVGGNRAVEVFFRGIREIETGNLAFFQ